MFGMAGGSAGQFVVGPVMSSGVSWSTFWIVMGIAGLVVSALLVMLLPASKRRDGGGTRRALSSLGVVFRNPQSILCGVIAGLLFIPTTIFGMVWGVRYLQEARGIEYGAAVMRSAAVPFGWIIGCPLLGFLSDRLGRRKPVIAGGALVLLGCLAWILYGPADVLPPYVLGLVAGVASGAAMLPYTVIKEANPPEASGTATGVVNFLNFTFSALLGPIFAGMLLRVSGGATSMTEAHYQSAFQPLLYGVGVAIALTLLLKETGPAARWMAAAPAVLKTGR
jgi:MFS family permease